MGNSTWSGDQYTAYASATSLRSLSREQTFTSRNLKEQLDPRKFTLRESRDSSFNPKSTPVIFALDVTGSMGYVAEEIAKSGLPKIMEMIYEKKPISDPHVMFMGIGDVNASDRAPLQMSQFEADIRIVEQLRELWLEGGGGGNGTESYNLPWYAAAYNTVTDAEARGERGFLFTIGDEMPPEPLARHNLVKVYGQRGEDMPVPADNHSLLETVGKKFSTFHIVAGDGSFARHSGGRVQQAWGEFMGPNALFLSNNQYLPELIEATMRIAKGADILETIREISYNSRCPADVLTEAFKIALRG